MSRSHVISAPPGSRILVARHLEGSCRLGKSLKEPRSTPNISWFVGNRRTSPFSAASMAKIDLPANFPRGTPWHKVHRNNRASNTTPNLRLNEKSVIMNFSVETQPVQATSTYERHSIHGIIRSCLYSCTKVILNHDII